MSLPNPLPQCPRPGSARAVDVSKITHFFVINKILGWFFVCIMVWLQGLQPLHGCSFLGAIGLSPHSRLRRQCGVIHNVTARAVKIAGNQMFRYDV